MTARALVVLLCLALPAPAVLSGCGSESAKREYVLAEKLWTDGKYQAAVSEFEKVHSRDPHGQLGLQALFRAAMTRAYFLSQYAEAVKKFQLYSETSHDAAKVAEAQRQIGELLFNKLEQYGKAVEHFQKLLKIIPDSSPDRPLFEYRLAKSYFYLSDFHDAAQVLLKLIEKHPGTPYAEKASYELGVTYFTQGEQEQLRQQAAGKANEVFQQAISAYRAFLEKYPNSELASQAQFGIASCLEEMDQLDAAYKAYQDLKSTYPSPKVIDIKLARIQERRNRRNH